MAIEQIWQTGPAAQIKNAVQQEQSNPLGYYLKGVAGFNAPQLSSLDASPASTVAAPTLDMSGNKPATVDPSGLPSFYSDPSNANFQNDPVLLQIEASDTTNSQNADASALKARRQLLTQLGSPELAKEILGPDDPTLGGVSSDPKTSTSVLARLGRNYGDTVKANEDQYNKANLWYGSARAQGLQGLADDYTTAESDATANARAALASIESQLAAAKNANTDRDTQAEADAYQRFLAALAANPPGAPAAPGGAGPEATSLPGEPGPVTTLPQAQHVPATGYGSVQFSPTGQVFSPVTVGSNAPSLEPHPTAANYGYDTATPVKKKATNESITAAALKAAGGVGKKALR